MKKTFSVWKDSNSNLNFTFFSNLKEKTLFRKLLGNLVYHGIDMRKYLLLFELLSSQKYLSGWELTRSFGLIASINISRERNIEWSHTLSPVKNSTLTIGSGDLQLKIGEYLTLINNDGFLIPDKLTKGDLFIEERKVLLKTGKSSSMPRTPSSVGTKSGRRSSTLPLIGSEVEAISETDIVSELKSFIRKLLEMRVGDVAGAKVENSTTRLKSSVAGTKHKSQLKLQKEFSKFLFGEMLEEQK